MYIAIDLTIFQSLMAAILNFWVKYSQYLKSVILDVFSGHLNPKNIILQRFVQQITMILDFSLVRGGHFGFRPVKKVAHSFARGTQAKFFI